MADWRKVVVGMEMCIDNIHLDCPIECPYYEQCTKYDNRFIFQPLLRDALEMLKSQPEIVMCKDCKHGAPTIINGVWLSVTCGDVDHRPEWFCADGKRSDDDG